MLSLSKHTRFAGLLALGACSPEQAAPPEGEKIACAVAPGAKMAKVCVLEITGESGQFVIHHPDGGFRRFGSDPDGGHMVLDGADELTGTYGFDRDFVELSVGGDRYAMPLSVLPERRGD